MNWRVVNYTKTNLEYDGFWHGRPGRCRLTYWPPTVVMANDATVGYPGLAVVTELDDNPGPSVTNAIENVAAAVERVVGEPVASENWILVEHYPRRKTSRETFDQVRLTRSSDGKYHDPDWKHIDPEEISRWVLNVGDRELEEALA